MNTYLKNISALFLLLVSISLMNCKSSQNVTESNILEPNRTVYWFYIYISFDKVGDSEIYAYDIKPLSSKAEKGTASQYDHLFWQYLSEGTKFAIGPFNTKEEAEQALLFYKIQDDLHSLDETYDKNNKIFWFVLKVKLRERSRSWELVRIPGAVASGTYSEFDVFLRDQLKTGVLTIGPFISMPDAEESKRVYRLH